MLIFNHINAQVIGLALRNNKITHKEVNRPGRMQDEEKARKQR